MGLINWIKDKYFLTLEHEVKLLKAEIITIYAELERNRSTLASFRSKLWRDPPKQETSDPQTDFAEIQRRFGGDVPIELAEKYNKGGEF